MPAWQAPTPTPYLSSPSPLPCPPQPLTPVPEPRMQAAGLIKDFARTGGPYAALRHDLILQVLSKLPTHS